MGKYSVPPLKKLDLVIPDPESPGRQEVAYLYFNPEERRLWFETRNRFEDSGIPMEVWHGMILRWRLPLSTDGEALSGAIADGEFDNLLDRIVAGFSSEWDGSNWVGRFSEDAVSAREEIYERLNGFVDNAIGVWEADEWLLHTPNEELGLSPGMTDEELEELAKKLEREAEEEHGIRLVNTFYVLQARRDGMIGEAEEDED